MNLKILNLTKQQESNIKLILSNQLDPKEFSSVQFWIGQCYNLPTLNEQKMCAFNQILFGFGIESVEGEWQNGYWCNILFTYVSMGFSDLPTIIHHRDKGFIVDSIENIITKSNRRARCQNKSLRQGQVRWRITQMIHGRLLPNSHPVAPNAKPKLRRVRQFITGHHHVKCFAPIVAMHHTVSFSQVQQMKMSTMVREILMPGKLKEGEIPFLVVGRRGIRSPRWKDLINIFIFLMVHPSHWQAFWFFRYGSGNHPSFIRWLFTSGIRYIVLPDRVILATPVTMMHNSTAVIRSSRLHIFFNEYPVYLPSTDFPFWSSWQNLFEILC